LINPIIVVVEEEEVVLDVVDDGDGSQVPTVGGAIGETDPTVIVKDGGCT
jgi:hypothetical protein